MRQALELLVGWRLIMMVWVHPDKEEKRREERERERERERESKQEPRILLIQSTISICAYDKM
jgi:hypothetical protein